MTKLPVEIWVVDLDASAEALFAAERQVARISTDEEERAARLPAGENRRRRAAYIAQRLLLERTCGPAIRGVVLGRGRNGRPQLPTGFPGAVSLAHTGRFALTGYTQARTIGVDLEAHRVVKMDARRQGIIVAAASTLTAGPLPATGDARFLRAWTRLEALAKADGRGMGHLLTQIGAAGGAKGAGIMWAAATAERAECRVQDLDLGDQLIGAVAVSSSAANCAVRTVPDNPVRLEHFVRLENRE